MNLKKYHPTISHLSPSKQGIVYHSEKWESKFADHRHYLNLVSEFEGRKISRGTIEKAFRHYYQSGNSLIKPFLLTMVWGFYSSGYGPHRTISYLLQDECKDLLFDSFNALKRHDVATAFDKLNTIKGLGMSYISKLLYFGGKAARIPEYPLIFDIRVATSLVSILSKEHASLIKAAPSNRFADYEKYNRLIHKWASKIDVEADQIEMFLFEQKF